MGHQICPKRGFERFGDKSGGTGLFRGALELGTPQCLYPIGLPPEREASAYSSPLCVCFTVLIVRHDKRDEMVSFSEEQEYASVEVVWPSSGCHGGIRTRLNTGYEIYCTCCITLGATDSADLQRSPIDTQMVLLC